MDFYPNQIFHIYNQGNNRQQIFFETAHYEFFIWKMRAYLLPFGDFIAYSLMPNHYHWQFFVKEVEISRKTLWNHVDEIEFLRRQKVYGEKAFRVADNNKRYAAEDSAVTLNRAIGFLQQAYTKSINKEKEWSGSLFRKRAKCKDGLIDKFITVNDAQFMPGSDYAYACFCYIHDNAKAAGLVCRNIDYLYSSARDYAGLRKGSLCNLELGRALMENV